MHTGDAAVTRRCHGVFLGSRVLTPLEFPVTPRTLISAAAALALGLALAVPAHATITFVNGLALPGSALDLSGGTTVNNGRIGYFSDIYYDTNRNEWWGLSDRGPGGGTLPYDTRVQRFTLDVNATTGAISNFQIAQTVVFSQGGSAMTGQAPATGGSLGNAFDPEGFVVNPKTGTFLVSDEYGPSLYEFDRNGNKLRTFTTPSNLIPKVGGATDFNASSTALTSGREGNRGFEGLAISPDGLFAYAMLQNGTVADGQLSGSSLTRSNHTRIVKFDIATGESVGQYAYQLKRNGQGQGISSLVALNDHEFMVLERNNRGVGVGADFATADKEVYKIDISGATDVSLIDLDSGSPFTAVVKGAKVIDLDANTIDLDGNGTVETTGKSPEKWEGLAVGPRLADGSFLILAGTDNDYSVTQNASGAQMDVYFRFSDADPYKGSIQCPLNQTTGCVNTTGGTPANLTGEYSLLPGVLHAYKASATDLAGYTAAVPEPESYALMLAGLGAFAALRRRTSR
jgi:hypothetical protein